MNNKNEPQANGPSARSAKDPNQTLKKTGTRNQKTTKNGTVFKGETPSMHGNVFEVLGEKGIKNQFKDTLEALERYAGETYSEEIFLLQPIFKRLERPKLEPPKPPTKKPAGTPTKTQKSIVKTKEEQEPSTKEEQELSFSDDQQSDTKTGEDEDALSEWDRLIHTERIKMYLRQEQRLKAAMIGIYNVAWGQCSRRMKDQLEANKKYADIKKNDDIVGLLRLVKVLSHQYAGTRTVEESIDDAVFKLMTYHQGENDSVSDHIRNIKNLCQVLEHYGGWFMNDQDLIKAEEKKDMDAGNAKKTEREYRKIVRNRAAALRALKSSRYKAVISDIRKKYLYKENVYPSNLAEAQELLNHYALTSRSTETRTAGQRKERNVGEANNVMRGAQYMQEKDDREQVPGTDGNVYDVTCFHCQKYGHYAVQCPGIDSTKKNETEEIHHNEEVSVSSEEDSGDESMIISMCNYLAGEKTYGNNSILLDTGSTVSVFKNTKMLTDVKDSGTTMRALTNGGYQDSTERGVLPGFFPVWVNRSSRMNILAMSDVRKKFRVTIDTGQANEIVVHLS